MKLSELLTGQEAYIIGIKGDSAIKDRMHEMGFVGGKKVKAIKSAPFKDPVEYDIMGYKLTIRKKDADLIVVEKDVANNKPVPKYNFPDPESILTDRASALANGQNNLKTFTVALVGNPNCGKTTIFNYATNSKERVANYSGVTVAAKEASFHLDGYTLKVIDLPGTYSLKPYSPEELYVYDYLVNHRPDIVINVVDAGNLERNLFLTTQLIDLGIDTVVAFNMVDELKKNNVEVDYKTLGRMLGIPFVPTVGKKGNGINELFKTAIEVFNGKNPTVRKVNISYGKEIDSAIEKVLGIMNKPGNIAPKPNKFVALQLISGFSNICKAENEELVSECKKIGSELQMVPNAQINTEIVNRRYGYIQGALTETTKRDNVQRTSLSQNIDKLLTHKILGIPVFFGIIWFIFYSTFKFGEVPMNWIEEMFGWISDTVSQHLPDTVFVTMFTEGIIGGVGGVFVFLPNIVILFFLISFLEDSGYMARTAFLMDKAMHKIGLHGKSFIPLLMGFGCNIPAIMATRTIESKRDRIVTMFITPFMSCSARLPVYVLFISAFFPKSQSLILFSIYGVGILAAFLTAIVLNKTIFRKTESPFVMELPPYRIPTLKAVGKHTWFKTSHFIKKMGTVILLASIIVWALGYFPRDKEIISKYDQQIEKTTHSLVAGNEINDDAQIESLTLAKESELLEQSYISRIGKAMEPVFEPLGFDWKMSVSILTGIMAKEVVVSSMGILYHAGADADETSQTLIGKLRASKEKNKVPLSAYLSFLVFVLLYFPCLGTLIAIRKETSGIKWTLFAAAYPLVFAWITSFAIFQLSNIFLT